MGVGRLFNFVSHFCENLDLSRLDSRVSGVTWITRLGYFASSLCCVQSLAQVSEDEVLQIVHEEISWDPDGYAPLG